MHIFKPEKKTQVQQKIRKPRFYRQALCLVSILSLIILQAGALLLRPVPVLASEGAASYNVAGYILSLLTSYNTAITNQQVLNSIVSTFGNMDCATASAAQIETGLSTIAQSTGFDLAPIFATSAEEAAAVAAVYEGWGESAIAAASASTNIEAGAKGLALAAAGGAGAAVLPVVGGVVLPAAAAVGIGVAGGFLIDHIRTSLHDYVLGGVELTTPQSQMQYIALYPNQASYGYSGSRYIISCGDGCFPIGYRDKNNPNVIYPGILSYSDESVANVWVQPQSGPTYFNVGANDVWLTPQTLWIDDYYQGLTIVNWGELGTIRSNIKNGIIPDPTYTKHSPDVVGDNGNLTGNYNNGSYTLPDVRPIYNPGTNIITYISPSDYQDLVNNANTNTGNGDTDAETQGLDFDTFTNPYIQPVTNPDPDPDPDPDPNPTSVPQPTQSPIEGVNPVPNPQPTSAPLPTPSPEEEEQLPEGMTNPDWKEKFPFCIPYDLLAFMQIWQEAREAPRFEFDLSFGTNGRYGLGVVVIDLAPFDSAAQLLRLLQLILFIVGLAIGTHKLLNPSGGGGD